jgi:hypothetical protein
VQRAHSLAEAQEREVAAGRLELAEAIRERRRQKEAAPSVHAASLPGAPVLVMDMRFCISHLDAIMREAGDFTLKDFSDYWAPDNKKTAPNKPNTFVPNRLVQGSSNPLWAPFYDPGLTRLGADGSLEVDPNHPPFFRASNELLGRMLHTMKK